MFFLDTQLLRKIKIASRTRVRIISKSTNCGYKNTYMHNSCGHDIFSLTIALIELDSLSTILFESFYVSTLSIFYSHSFSRRESIKLVRRFVILLIEEIRRRNKKNALLVLCLKKSIVDKRIDTRNKSQRIRRRKYF